MPEIHKYCASCGSELRPLELSCPQCHQMVYAQEMEDLARQAREKESAGDTPGASALWRQVLALLPPETAQASTVRDRIARLGATAGPIPQLAGPAQQETFRES